MTEQRPEQRRGINPKEGLPNGWFNLRTNRYRLYGTGRVVTRRISPELSYDQFMAHLMIAVVMFPKFPETVGENAEFKLPNPLKILLTPKQEEVYGLILKGHSNHEIAATTGTTPNTAKNHVKAIMSKTGLHSKGKLIEYARRIEKIENFDDDLVLNPPKPIPVKEYLPTVKEQIPYDDLWWHIAKGYSERGIAQRLRLDRMRVRLSPVVYTEK